MLDLLVEVPGPGDERAVDDEELALQAMREGPANGGLARAWRPDEKNATLRADTEIRGELVVLERQNDLRLELVDERLQAAKRRERNGLHFADLHVRGHPTLTESRDELLRFERPILA